MRDRHGADALEAVVDLARRAVPSGVKSTAHELSPQGHHFNQDGLGYCLIDGSCHGSEADPSDTSEEKRPISVAEFTELVRGPDTRAIHRALDELSPLRQ
jgi:hypothetical protein